MGASVSDPDQNFSAGIADKGGIAILDNHGTVIDRVGMCVDTLYREGSPLPPMASNVDGSYERISDGASGNFQDTENNLADFILITPSDPESMSDQ